MPLLVGSLVLEHADINNVYGTHSFIHQWLYGPLLGPGLFFTFVKTQTVGLLGRVISLSQGRYLHIEHNEHRIIAHTDIHALNGIRIHDPSVRAGEDSSCLRPRDHCDRHVCTTNRRKFEYKALF
jgi:hypothetical protein